MSDPDPSTKIFNFRAARHIVDADMEASFTPDLTAEHPVGALKNEYIATGRYEISWTDTNSPIGDLILEGSETREAADFIAVPVAAGDVVGLPGGAVIGDDGEITLDGTTAGAILVNVPKPWGYMRWRWVRTGGGENDLLNIRASGNTRSGGGAVAADPTPMDILGLDDGTTGITAFWSGGNRTLNGADVSNVINGAFSGSADQGQVTASLQPLLVSDANSRDAFKFDRSEDHFLFNQPTASPVLWKANDFMAMWIVWRMDLAPASQSLAMLSFITDAFTASVNGIRARFDGNAVKTRFVTVGGNTDVATGTLTDTTSYHLLHLRTEATQCVVAFDGGSDITTATSDGKMSKVGTNASMADILGGGVPAEVTIAEIDIWHGTSQLAAPGVLAMRNYHLNKYALGF